MTHELKKLVESYNLALKESYKTVLATVVALDGSSYRKPGVRMLIWENGRMEGAVSGGCVEKEVLRQTETVFKTGAPKIMTYDGRYRLGCEGVLYILLEPFSPSQKLISLFNENLEKRNSFEIISYYIKQEGEPNGIGSHIRFLNEDIFYFSGINKERSIDIKTDIKAFNQIMPPCFKLVIIGAEHDAVELCLLASLSGWEVTVISSLSDPKTTKNFPGSKQVVPVSPEDIGSIPIDEQTAIVLMTHNFARDLKFLVALKESSPIYLGLLGARDRKEKLMSQLLELHPEINLEFLESIHGPAGLSIGAITPQEIAISIIAEILSVQRLKKPTFSTNKMETLHS